MKNINKQTVVFLPGWGFKSSIWEETSTLLDGFDVRHISPFEESNPLEMKKLAEKWCEIIPPHSTIVAWSISGLFAIYFSYYFPERCQKLILVSSLPKFSTDNAWIGISEENVSHFKLGSENHFENIFHKFLSLTQFPDRNTKLKHYIKMHTIDFVSQQQLLKHYLNFMFDSDFCEYFKKIINVYCVFSEGDAIVPIKSANQLKLLHPQVKLEVIPNASHIPFLTHPHLFFPLLLKVLHA